MLPMLAGAFGGRVPCRPLLQASAVSCTRRHHCRADCRFRLRAAHRACRACGFVLSMRSLCRAGTISAHSASLPADNAVRLHRRPWERYTAIHRRPLRAGRTAAGGWYLGKSRSARAASAGCRRVCCYSNRQTFSFHPRARCTILATTLPAHRLSRCICQSTPQYPAIVSSRGRAGTAQSAGHTCRHRRCSCFDYPAFVADRR